MFNQYKEFIYTVDKWRLPVLGIEDCNLYKEMYRIIFLGECYDFLKSTLIRAGRKTKFVYSLANESQRRPFSNFTLGTKLLIK